VAELLSPGNYVLVQQGMQLRIVPTDKLDWPPPFKAATEKYSPQVQLAPDGSLKGYTAGQPFPLVDPNDPQVATKVMWNFSYRPLYSDDIDMRFPEVATFDKHAAGYPLSYYTVGHFAFYNNIGRIEVPPVPTDPNGLASGLRYRFGFYPFLEPSSLRGYGISIPKSRTTSGFSIRRPASCVASRPSCSRTVSVRCRDSAEAAAAAEAGVRAVWEAAAVLRPMRIRWIRIRTSASRRRSRISITGSSARRRCWLPCTRCIRPSPNVRRTAAERYARKIGRCAICT
jgi:hypothetical protein